MGNQAVTLVDRLHSSYVHGRRVDVLARHLSALIPEGASVLDVGCGDGLLASRIHTGRSDLTIRGIDVLRRPATHIPVESFDGTHIPAAARSFDAVLIVDTIHHVDDPMPLLLEAVRVSRRHVVIKDHTRDGWLASATLRMMDAVGNARHGVALPYNYWPKSRWLETFDALDLTVSCWKDRLNLYPVPADWIFGRSLHFLARLDVRDSCEPTEPHRA